MKKGVIIGLLILSVVGVADAGYLTIEHYRQAGVACFNISSCDRVLASQYATIGLVPVSLLGVAYYLLLSGIFAYALARRDAQTARLGMQLTALGFFASLVFVFLQFFVIRAVCLYCMTSAAVCMLLFAGSRYALSRTPRLAAGPISPDA